ncbi:phosphatase PAP2 family protein [Leuconostoc pseudomesenteroides]|uniref:phosphatase PAP2 family protein n=1 Tax=Leuconostoc pseudomesenteroides TaxID=33968 RepID=UPI00166BB8C2|nr:phosphatase PAP2 family protein [Leuconostoc pseudomesenteroides]
MDATKKSKYYYISIILLCLLIIQTILVYFFPKNPIDVYSNLWLHTKGIIGQLMIIITHIANPVVAIIITISIVLAFHVDRLNRYLVFTKLFGAIFLAISLKYIFHRARPDNQIIIDHGFSYPSIHTVTAVVLSLTFYELFKEKTTHQSSIFFLCVAWIILVMVSRISLGNHYLTDTSGALLLTGFWISLCNYIIATKHIT